MLDKQTSELLRILNVLCKDSTYKVLSKREIIEKLATKFEIDEECLSQMLNHLAVRNYLDVKYFDNTVYCLAVLPKGKMFDEKVRELSSERKKINKSLTILVVTSTICGFLGAFLGALLSNLIL